MLAPSNSVVTLQSRVERSFEAALTADTMSTLGVTYLARCGLVLGVQVGTRDLKTEGDN